MADVKTVLLYATLGIAVLAFVLTITEDNLATVEDISTQIADLTSTLTSYINAQIATLNISSTAFTNAQTALINSSVINLTNAQIAVLNSSLITYTNTQTTLVNSSAINYTNAQIALLNSSLINYTNASVSQINNSIISYVDNLVYPHATLSSNLTQSINPINTPQLVNFTTNDDIEDIIHLTTGSNTSAVGIVDAGEYLFIVSAIADIATGAVPKHLQIWFRVNGVDVPNSNTLVAITNLNEEFTVAVAIYLDLEANDVVHLVMAGDATTVRLLATAKTAYSPATPSVIMTVQKVGASGD